MNFRAIKESLINKILGPSEKDRFRVIGFQRQVKNAKEVLDFERLVQVYYSSSEFSKSGGRFTGPVQHDVTFGIELSASKSTQGDLAILENPSSTNAQRSIALAGIQEASNLVDESMDELLQIVYQILMDARNIDIGFPAGVVSNRWVSRMQKDSPPSRGEFVMLSGLIDFTLRTIEEIEGDKGTVIATEFDVVVDQDDDDVEKAGTSGTLGG